MIFSLGVLFSPHIAFWVGILLLLTRLAESKIFRNMVCVSTIIMIIITSTSRQIGYSPSDDLVNTYMPIIASQNSGRGIFDTWMGVEIGYVVFSKFIVLLLGHPEPRVVLFCSLTLMMVLYYIWITFFALPQVDNKNKGFILAVSLAFIQVGFLSQFIRQEIATPILLMAIYFWASNKKKVSVLFLVFSFLFHSTSLIIFAIFIIANLSQIKWKLIVFTIILVFSVLLKFSPGLLVSIFYAIHLPFIGYKLQYYTSGNTLPLANAFLGGKFLYLILVFFFLGREKELSSQVDKFCFWGVMYCLPLIFFPNAVRLSLIITGFLFPFVIYENVAKKIGYFKIVFAFFCILSLFFPQRLNGGVNDGFELWHTYNWYGSEPFYYSSGGKML